MKKKIAKVLVAGLIGLQLIGCSNQNTANTEENGEVTEESTESTENTEGADTTERVPIYFKEINADEYVALGEYKGLEVVSNVQVISDEEVEKNIEYMLSMSGTREEVTDRDVVENGDIANIDYEGKKDGVAFDGGTAQGYDLGIGTGSFIPGFEEGLVGVKKGETVDLNLTFPENYPAEDLAGAEVVFTVTVNGIYKEVIPEFNDEFVAGLQIENVATTDEYRAYLKAAMEESEKEYAMQEVQTQLLNMVTENAEISEAPQELIDRFYNININNMNYQAMMYGMDLESFVSAYYGMDAETFEAETVAAAEISADQALVCLKIAADENIDVTEGEMNAAVEENYAGYGYASADEFKTAIDMEEYRDSLLLNKIVDFLVENATITEVPELTE